MKQLLFSTRGRVSRATFWGVGIGWAVAIGLVTGVAVAVSREPEPGTAATLVLSLLMFVMLVAAVWSGLCLGIKRYHDLGKAGAWVLIQFVPVIGTAWYFVEAGCFRGTDGANAYGPASDGAGRRVGAQAAA